MDMRGPREDDGREKSVKSASKKTPSDRVKFEKGGMNFFFHLPVRRHVAPHRIKYSKPDLSNLTRRKVSLKSSF